FDHQRLVGAVPAAGAVAQLRAQSHWRIPAVHHRPLRGAVLASAASRIGGAARRARRARWWLGSTDAMRRRADPVASDDRPRARWPASVADLQDGGPGGAGAPV